MTPEDSECTNEYEIELIEAHESAPLFRGHYFPNSFLKSKLCPVCDHSRSRSVETAPITSCDRICSDCGVRYTVPTPLSAIILFPLLGVLLLLWPMSPYMTGSIPTGKMELSAMRFLMFLGVGMIVAGIAFWFRRRHLLKLCNAETQPKWLRHSIGLEKMGSTSLHEFTAGQLLPAFWGTLLGLSQPGEFAVYRRLNANEKERIGIWKLPNSKESGNLALGISVDENEKVKLIVYRTK